MSLDDLPTAIVQTDPDVVAGFAHDEARLVQRSTPAAVLSPRDTDEVAACLRAARAAGLTVVTRGAGTGLAGGANAPAGSVVLSTRRLDRIVAIDVEERVAVVQPGVLTGDLRAAVEEVGLFYPPDPGSVAISTIGGNVATDAGGMCCVKYGVTGDYVLGLEVVLADGRVLRTGRRTVKGVAGYDLTHLLVGSEGTLGVITEVTLRLRPAPPAPATVVATFASLPDAGRAVERMSADALDVSLLELLDATTLRAIDAHTGMGLDAAAMLLVQSDQPDPTATLAAVQRACEGAGAVDVAVTTDVEEGRQLLEARRQALPALERLGDWLLDDVCVPRRAIVALVQGVEQVARAEGLTIGVFGHAGDGNMHPTVIFDQQDPESEAAARRAFDAITALALDLGGTVTGEHGVGRLKAGWLARELDPVALDVHRAVKAALDPEGRLNPGSVLGARR
ncbi:FAD-binding oxidoreductase [Aeromicrobium erythreum]|uniref:FAD-linked oxidase n=1 Tax=Aeromicrobium erythreum TaxID=2041 RepID=A0A0U3T5Q4_9ACTN|nr:FAD-linked oxidase C-terminal domain-containing protein [Aeromicrobium erythreum]ALX05944.1 FAD-linked oxidase [Aeromicrobium erythreum]